jgi:hypothetical protein
VLLLRGEPCSFIGKCEYRSTDSVIPRTQLFLHYYGPWISSVYAFKNVATLAGTQFGSKNCICDLYPKDVRRKSGYRDCVCLKFSSFLIGKFQKSTITVRLTFLAHSVRMRPNFQGLPWCKCYGLGKDELLIRFYWIDNLGNLLWFYFQSLGANLVQVFIACDKHSTDYSLT